MKLLVFAVLALLLIIPVSTLADDPALTPSGPNVRTTQSACTDCPQGQPCSYSFANGDGSISTGTSYCVPGVFGVPDMWINIWTGFTPAPVQ